jgi:hypothetical protein
MSASVDFQDVLHPRYILAVVIRWNHPSDLAMGSSELF